MFSSLQSWLGFSEEETKKKPLRKTRRDRRVKKKQIELNSGTSLGTSHGTSLVTVPEDSIFTLNTSSNTSSNTLSNEEEHANPEIGVELETTAHDKEIEPIQHDNKEVVTKKNANKTRSRRKGS